jgi:uncharacterized protein (TIGR00299 family) protein
MTLLYLDAFAGLSGDMFLAALIDAGADPAVVQEAIETLGLSGVTIVTRVERKGALAGTRVEFQVPSSLHVHRHWADIRSLIENSSLAESVKARSLAVFGRLAAVEAAVHGVEIDRVHFHEVGAIDSIADIVGAAALTVSLGVERVVCSPLPLGRGFVETAHGRLPLPAPATARLLEGIPIRGEDIEAELVTPTGAALAAVLAEGYGPLPDMVVSRVGHGLGSRDLPDRPNLLRIFLGTSEKAAAGLGAETVALLTARIDDQTPELLAATVEKLMAAGALDAALTPLIMKKGRPGVEVSVMARPDDARRLAGLLLVETGSLGVRHQEVRRWVLDREVVTVETEYGPVRIKIGRLEGEPPLAAPEFEDVRRLAADRGVPARVVYQAAVAAAQLELKG